MRVDARIVHDAHDGQWSTWSNATVSFYRSKTPSDVINWILEQAQLKKLCCPLNGTKYQETVSLNIQEILTYINKQTQVHFPKSSKITPRLTNVLPPRSSPVMHTRCTTC